MTDHNVSEIDVSVLIAVWNAEDTIGRAIQSVLDQKDVSVEVFVIDDCSTDATVDVAETFSKDNAHVHVLRQISNGGPAKARNAGLNRALGTFVTVLDSDDYMKEGRLAQLLNIATGRNYDFVGDDLLRLDQDRQNAVPQRLWSTKSIGHQDMDLTFFIKANMTTANGSRGELGFLKPLMNRSFLEANGLRYDERMRLGEDYQLYAAALACGARFCLTDPAGYIAVMREGSLSSVHSTRDLHALVEADIGLLDSYDLSIDETNTLKAHVLDTRKRWLWLRLIDAVKGRDALDALRCFVVDPHVSVFLLGKLFEQVLLRSGLRRELPRG